LDYQLNKNCQGTFLIRELYMRKKNDICDIKNILVITSDIKINYTIKIPNNENSLKFNIFR